MKPYFYYLTGIAVGIALLVIYCEFLIYYAIQLNVRTSFCILITVHYHTIIFKV